MEIQKSILFRNFFHLTNLILSYLKTIRKLYENRTETLLFMDGFFIIIEEKTGDLMFMKYNPNPQGKSIGDCVVRSISKVLGCDWERIYIELTVQGFMMCDMPSANAVWGAYLRNKGFTRHVIPDSCPDCYTVADFAEDNPHGKYILATGSHVVAVVDGNYYDTWDSGAEVPVYYWKKEG